MKKCRKARELAQFSGNLDLQLGRVTAAAEVPEEEPAPGTGVAGIFKLKAHVDNPGQTPM